MSPSNQCRGQQPYWVSNDPTAEVGELPHVLSQITFALFLTTAVSGANTVIVAPVPNAETKQII